MGLSLSQWCLGHFVVLGIEAELAAHKASVLPLHYLFGPLYGKNAQHVFKLKKLM